VPKEAPQPPRRPSVPREAVDPERERPFELESLDPRQRPPVEVEALDPGQRGPLEPSRGRRTRTVVISDVHIGTNSRTCWYQRAIHEPYLAAVLDYVIANADDAADDPVGRLVLLGDLFDFWTYPPGERPPTIDEVIAANEGILGPGGKLCQAVEALCGNAVYLRGNHDLNVTQNDLDRLPLGGYRIPLVDDVILDGSGILMTHGHLFTMFNAPDARYPGEVPVGHFVTRAIADYLDRTLAPGQTAADLPSQGSPYGFDLASFVPALSGLLAGPSVTNALLDYIAARCGISQSTPIHMADGSTKTIAEAKSKYDGLWASWVNRYGGGQVGETVAAKAAQADYDGSYIAWFAQKEAFEHSARGVVMGHTHVPRQGIEGSTCLYVNGGFECPAVPDVGSGAAAFNFTIIDAAGTPELWRVGEYHGTYRVTPDRAPADQLVYAPFDDFSCYLTITNNTSGELTRAAESADNGYYVARPPQKIAAGATERFWIQDFAGVHGAEGGAAYRAADGGEMLEFTYGCPTGFFQNYAGGGSSFVASSGSPPGALQPRDVVPPYGHPLFVDFQVGDGAGAAGGGASGAAPTWTPTSALAIAVDAAGFRYDPQQDIIYSRMYPLQRYFGYAYAYDAAALAMNAIIDCEPIFFDYAGKTWMIELWKGQYGLETGCEIGVYNRPIGSSSFVYSILDATIGRRPGDPAPSHNLFFDCANDNELLSMSSVLYRNGQRLFSRGPERHWWLTGFKWGVLSEPGDLVMDVSITCLDGVMTTALVNALQGMGYTNVSTTGTTVSFRFDTPRTPQPRESSPQLVSYVRGANQQIVGTYNGLGLTSNDPNTVGDAAASTILRSVAIYGEQFFAGVLANVARIAGVDVSAVIRALTDGFGVVVDAAARFVTDAGYTLAAWIGALQTALSESLDFSCVTEISNRGGPYELVREDYGVVYGNYAIAPPERIPPGGTGRFWLKDPKPSIHGAQGWARYGYVDVNGVRHTVQFTYDCPTGLSANTAAVSMPFFTLYAKSGNVASPWGAPFSVPPWGHPLYVAFVWGAARPP
jgi:UDP-2,3-diacylglucosamine pyrophosphatase LpxH